MKLIVAIDFSPITEKVLEYIKNLAKTTDFAIWIIHVVQPDPDFVGYEVGPQTERDFVAKKFNQKHKDLQQKAQELKKLGINATPLLLQGATVETILSEADDIDADMIVAGSHGHGMMYNLLVGSVSKELLRKSKRAVLIIPADEED